MYLIKENRFSYPEAYWVKIADIKDHLLHSEIITDELKKKYLENSPYLIIGGRNMEPVDNNMDALSVMEKYLQHKENQRVFQEDFIKKFVSLKSL